MLIPYIAAIMQFNNKNIHSASTGKMTIDFSNDVLSHRCLGSRPSFHQAIGTKLHLSRDLDIEAGRLMIF